MKNILNGKVLIAMVVIASLLLCGSLAYILVMRPAAAASPNLAAATSALTIIPAPSSTPLPLPPTLTPIPAHPGTVFHPCARPDRHRRLCAAQYRRSRSAGAYAAGTECRLFLSL